MLIIMAAGGALPGQRLRLCARRQCSVVLRLGFPAILIVDAVEFFQRKMHR